METRKYTPAISALIGIFVIFSLAGSSMQPAQLLAATKQAAVEAEKTIAIVEMTDAMKYSPEKVTIKVGETIEWKNTSKIVHTVTNDPSLATDKANALLPEGAKPFNSGKINAGKTFSHKFEVAGTYRYFCIPHEKMGMVGEVIVEK